jgi:hypothetical protein
VRFVYQPCFDWIEIDVVHDHVEVLIVPDEAIPVVGLPERAAPTEQQVRFACRKTLP